MMGRGEILWMRIREGENSEWERLSSWERDRCTRGSEKDREIKGDMYIIYT